MMEDGGFGGGVGGSKVSKLSKILGNITTIAYFDTYEGSVKSANCVQMVSFGDGWGTGEGGVKSVSIPPRCSRLHLTGLHPLDLNYVFLRDVCYVFFFAKTQKITR